MVRMSVDDMTIPSSGAHVPYCEQFARAPGSQLRPLRNNSAPPIMVIMSTRRPAVVHSNGPECPGWYIVPPPAFQGHTGNPVRSGGILGWSTVARSATDSCARNQ